MICWSCSLESSGSGGIAGAGAAAPAIPAPVPDILWVSDCVEEVDASLDLSSGVTGLAARPLSDAVLESAVPTSGKSSD